MSYSNMNSPEFSISLGDVPAETHIETVIGALDEYCAKQRIKVCLVLDEFQEICTWQIRRRSRPSCVEACNRQNMCRF